MTAISANFLKRFGIMGGKEGTHCIIKNKIFK